MSEPPPRSCVLSMNDTSPHAPSAAGNDVVKTYSGVQMAALKEASGDIDCINLGARKCPFKVCLSENALSKFAS